MSLYVIVIFAFSLSIHLSLGRSFVIVVDSCLEGDLDLFFLVCFELNDFSCRCRVCLSLVQSMVLLVGAF